MTTFDPEFVSVEFSPSASMPIPSEPDHFCHRINGSISLLLDDGDELAEVGEMSLIDVRLDLAEAYGFAPFDVLDADANSAKYLELVHGAAWSELVEDQFAQELMGGDILILDRMTIKPEYRGRGLGLLAACHAIEVYGRFEGLAACIPFPLQYEGMAAAGWVAPEGVTDVQRGFEVAQAKLRFYWARLGFEQVGDTQIWARSNCLRHLNCRGLLESLRNPPPPGKKATAAPGRARHKHGSPKRSTDPRVQ